METAKEMIEALGGARRLRGVLSVSEQAVYNMAARNRIHPRHWRALIKDARRHQVRGINIDRLLDMAEGEDA